ncbi:MAG: cobyrinate a,c-diamide synthase, partial [Pelosinus sp.]|nr:cobyrinate a,c-diamide synthase [Pelosinus sp.]
AGTNSGVGKTTLVTGLLAAFRARGLKVQSYKVGPDYIDPGYHYLASGQRSHNLDSWLMNQESLLEVFASTAQGNDLVIIEGVMGLYDGGKNGISSSAAIAKLLKAPVALVIDAKAMGESAAALALGYKMYDPEIDFAGVLVNRLGSLSHQSIVTEALENRGIPVLGCFRRDDSLKMPERHLGLTPVEENDARALVDKLGAEISRQIKLDELFALAKKAPPLPARPQAKLVSTAKVRLGVAQDEAFSFYYPESLGVLEKLGAELVAFSPLFDQKLPEVDGLLFGGGFPEMFASELTANQKMRKAIYRAASEGMPVYAECGGLMYLTERLVDFSGQAFLMAGVIPAECRMQSKLQTVGYVEAKALKSNILCSSGSVFRGHEFHFSQMTPLQEKDFPWAFEFTKNRTGAKYFGGYADKNVVASYLHMHFMGQQGAAEQFIEKCTEYKESHCK